MTEAFHDMAFKQNPDISQVFLRHLDRLNQSITSDDPYAYEAYVRQFMLQIPSHYREWVLEDDQTNRYNSEVSRFDYKEFCTIPLGTPDNPLMKENDFGVPYIVKRDEEGNINWDDPNIISPHLITETITDYEKLNEVIMEAAEKAGLTWQLDYREKQIPNPEIKKKRKRTPYRKPRDVQEEAEEED